MRWRLLRRRLSISAPRMTVRSHLPWPLRWAVAAVALGFSGALALWAFEFGKSIAGLDVEARQMADTLARTRAELDVLRQERDRSQAFANTADSLLKAERATQQRLTEQVKALEAENQALKDDLGFFERLLPASGEGLAVRGLQVGSPAPGQLRYQLLVMQQGGRTQPEFKGRFEVTVSGLLNNQPWQPAGPVVRQTLQVRQYQRIDGMVEIPSGVVVKQVQVKVLDEQGRLHATQAAKL